MKRQVRMFGGKRVYGLKTISNGRIEYWEVKANGGRLTSTQAKYDRMARNDDVIIRYMQMDIDTVSGAIRNIYW